MTERGRPMTNNQRETILEAIECMRRAERFLRQQTPESLRAWADRREDSGGHCLPAAELKSAAYFLEACLDGDPENE